MESVSDKELELRYQISRFINETVEKRRESGAEVARFQEHVQKHHQRAAAIVGKLGEVQVPSRDPTPEVKRPKERRDSADDSRLRITLRLPSAETSTTTPSRRGRPATSSTSRGRPRTKPLPTHRETSEPWHDLPPSPRPKKKPPTTTPHKRGPKLPPTDPLLSGGFPARNPDGSLIPNSQLPWNQLTNEELARLRKRMKKNSGWTPSVTMIVRELEALGRGPNNRSSFADAHPTAVVGPEDGGIGDPHKILPEDGPGARENKGMRLNRAKKRKREEEKAERAREATRLGLDPEAEERKIEALEAAHHREQQQLKRKRKREEEEAARLAVEAEATTLRLAQERAELESRLLAETAAKEKALAEAEQLRLERETAEREKIAAEAAAEEARRSQAAAEAVIAEAAAKSAKKQTSPPSSSSDDELSDVASPPPPRRPALPKPPRATSARPKRASAAPTPPPAPRSTSARPANRGAPRGRGGARGGRWARKKSRGGSKGAEEEEEEDLNKYCLCNEVSRGTMVACENEGCPKVWFHIGCVGLTKEEAEREEVKWFCPICEEGGAERGGRKRRRKA